MIEYPSIINSSKAPRANCVGFAKFDGSNFRAKWTQKKGFNLFGSRRELIDESHKYLGEAVSIFKRDYEKSLSEFFKKEKELRNHREIIVFGEFFGTKSYAGLHVADDPKDLVIFDVLVGHKDRWFYSPLDFIKTYQSIVKIPPVLYMGNLNDQLINDVRTGKYDEEFHRLTDNKFSLFEGMLCKGTIKTGAYVGKIWMCKIKTQKYLDSLRERYGEEGVKKYGE